MGFLIQPLAGVGDIRFGMSQEQVREVMRTPYETFMKASWSRMPTDSFLDDAVHVFYGDTGCCEAVELFEPSQILLDGKDLLSIPYSEAKQYVAIRDSEVDEDDSGFTSYALGVGMYAPRHRERPDRKAVAVIVFEKGYYARHGMQLRS